MITALDPNTALVLIDLQKGILQYPAVDSLAGLLANAAKLVAAFREADLPIVIVNVNPFAAKRRQTRTETPSVGGMTAPPADWLEIVPEIKTGPADIFITKHSWGAFFETALDEELLKRNVTGIVLAGVSTSIGVEGTARGASERGYNISFASDAMTDRVASAQENSLRVIFPRIGEVGDTDQIIAVLSGLHRAR